MPQCVLLLICVVICASLQALMQLWVLNLLLLLAMGRPGHHLISVEQKCSSLLLNILVQDEEYFIRAKNCFKSILFCHFIIMFTTNLLQKNLITYKHKGNQPHPIYNKYIGIGQFVYSIHRQSKECSYFRPVGLKARYNILMDLTTYRLDVSQCPLNGKTMKYQMYLSRYMYVYLLLSQRPKLYCISPHSIYTFFNSLKSIVYLDT